jgi:hypothetical protein
VENHEKPQLVCRIWKQLYISQSDLSTQLLSGSPRLNIFPLTQNFSNFHKCLRTIRSLISYASDHGFEKAGFLKTSIFGIQCHVVFCKSTSSGLKSKKATVCLKLVSCLAYSSTLKTEVICSTETSADFQWTTRHYISEERTLHNRSCENPKPNKLVTFLPFPLNPPTIQFFSVYKSTLRGHLLNL